MTREMITKLKDTIRELIERRDELGRRAQASVTVWGAAAPLLALRRCSRF
jgi:hypothetical protein